MTDEQTPTQAGAGEVEDLRISAFWQAARGHVGLGKMDAVMGGTPDDVVPPPSWSYGNGPEAEALLARVLAGAKTSTATVLAQLTSAGLEVPRVGDLSIVTDAAGEPKAVLRTTEVQVVPFDQVSEEHVAAEGAAEASHEAWVAEHEASFTAALGDAFTPASEVVLERFEIIYPTSGPTPAVD
ncbi:ASCH domain-containing protein [Cellulomonas sp. URHE0023]|uniref:ASCH domain-containing protein n=1 Tax=Cellulomonas sp. URHE0023 TaxID=1380354 RepID=UPI00048782D0|nr:ASCH domain-containing protein [Cellulomonas sp. URHE0023]